MTYQIEGDMTLLTLRKNLAAPRPVSSNNTIALDFCNVGQIDSSLLSYILHIIRHAAHAGQIVRLFNLPANFTELARLYGIHDLLQPYLCSTQ